MMDKQKIAANLKLNRTASEIRFARHLKSVGIHFEEQVVICGYIPDFYFPSHGHKIIELDGRFHKGREAYDANRDAILLQNGFAVLRVPSSSVFGKFAWLMETVSDFLGTAVPVPLGKRREKKPIKKRGTPKPKKLVAWQKAKMLRLNKQGLPKARQW